MDATQRLHGLDFLRASMMLLGIVLHGAQMYMTMALGFDYYKDPQLSPVMDGVLIFINTFRMPTFFFISGFFTALLYERYALRGMVRNRVDRIVKPFVLLLPPVAIVLSLQWIAASQLMATGSAGLDVSYVRWQHLLYDNLHHLWFLYYLIIILAGWIVIMRLWQALPPALTSRAGTVASRVSPAGFAPIALLGLLGATLALDNWAGRVNAGITFTPYWNAVAFFGLCFVAGWGLWFRRSALRVLEQRCWAYLGIATLCFGLALAAFFQRGEYQSPSWTLLHPVLVVGNGLSVAFYVAGLTGVFSRYCGGYSPRVRYVSDSAYWVYILHQPALLLFAMPMYHLPWPAEIKFLLVCIATTILCLATYDVWVRNTALGVLLNGKRQPRGLPLNPLGVG